MSPLTPIEFIVSASGVAAPNRTRVVRRADAAVSVAVATSKVSGKDFTTTVGEFFKAIGLLNPEDKTEKADSEPEQRPSTEPVKKPLDKTIYI